MSRLSFRNTPDCHHEVCKLSRLHEWLSRDYARPLRSIHPWIRMSIHLNVSHSVFPSSVRPNIFSVRQSISFLQGKLSSLRLFPPCAVTADNPLTYCSDNLLHSLNATFSPLELPVMTANSITHSELHSRNVRDWSVCKYNQNLQVIFSLTEDATTDYLTLIWTGPITVNSLLT